MSELKEGLEERLEAVRRRLADACRAAGRGADDVRLLAVSKTFPPEAVELAALRGQRAFGENYVQEGVEKIAWFRDRHPELALEWHFIGPLQSNKTRPVAEHFDWVQSLNRMKVAQRLSAQRPAGMPALNVLVEVNVDGEATKSGVAPGDALAFAREVAGLPALRLRGFMAIPAPETDPARQAEPFRRMRELFLQARAEGLDVDTLSMGMSADFEAAVREGSTMVRVGSAIFGARHYPPAH